MNDKIKEAIAYKGPDRVVRFTDYLLTKAEAPTLKTFHSQFEAFDKNIGGLQTGEVVVVSGNRKNGKTLFVESWIRSMVKQDPSANPVFFSFEVLPEVLLAKYVSEPEMPIYLPLTLKMIDFEWFKKKCLEAKYKFNCRVIMIDHLHYMVDMAIKQNMSLNIGAFMRRLKQDIAIDLKMAVILVAHQGQPREGKEASMDTLRDSSFVSQESDSTIIVSRRKNLDEVEVRDYESTYGADFVSDLKPPVSVEKNEYSAGLAIVKVDCHRRTGVYQWKKLFQKRGNFMEEV